MGPLFFAQVGWVAASCFIAAFVLTFWPSRVRSSVAAILFGIGILTRLSTFAYAYFTAAGAAWGFSRDTQPPGVTWWAMPVQLVLYALAACILLWPTIPQQRALLLGKILHLLFGVPLFAFLLIPRTLQFHTPLELTWLVYALLWFRIREGYAEAWPGQIRAAGSGSPSSPHDLSEHHSATGTAAEP
jgi:hypothetical protein